MEFEWDEAKRRANLRSTAWILRMLLSLNGKRLLPIPTPDGITERLEKSRLLSFAGASTSLFMYHAIAAHG